MRITRIELKNFRNHEDLSIDLTAPRLLLLGPNGSGKSSVLDAIAWAILGRCRGINEKGQGQADLIRNGATEAQVILTTDVLGKVNRAISRAGGSVVSMKTEAQLTKLGVTEGMLRAVLYGQTFFDLHHADAKALLMDALDVRVTREQLTLEDGTALTEQDSLTLDELEAEYQAAFADRAALKKQAAAVIVPAKPKVVSIDAGLPEKSIEDVQRRFQAIIQQATEQEAAAKAADRAATKAQEMAGDLGRLTGAIAVHRGMLASATTALATAKAALETAKALPADPVDQLRTQTHEQGILIDKLARHDPDRGCVLSAAIPCLTRAAEFTGQIDKLKKDVSALQGRVEAGEARAAAMLTANQAIKDAERNVAYHQNQIDGLEAQEKAATAAGGELDGLRAEAADMWAQVETSRAAADQEREQVGDLARKIQAAEQYRAALEAHQRGMERQAELKAEVARAEQAVKILGPSGVRLTALQAALGGFEAAINTALQPFGFTVSITPDPWGVVVETGLGPVRFEMLSKGQRLWTGLAFQLALATVSGLRFCALDDIEAVVGHDRRLLTGAIMLADVDQIVVAMARAADEPAPALDGLQVERL